MVLEKTPDLYKEFTRLESPTMLLHLLKAGTSQERFILPLLSEVESNYLRDQLEAMGATSVILPQPNENLTSVRVTRYFRSRNTIS